jgi:hypothetical protein
LVDSAQRFFPDLLRKLDIAIHIGYVDIYVI